MKFKQAAIVPVASLFLLISCKKDSAPPPVYGCTDPTSTNYNPSATADNGTCKYQGYATFWYNSGGTNATVIVITPAGNLTASINGNYYYTSTPSCGTNYCANFTLPPGTYSFSASSTFSTWSGTIKIYKNQCSTMLLQ